MQPHLFLLLLIINMEKKVSQLFKFLILVSSLLVGCSNNGSSSNDKLSFNNQTSKIFVNVKCDYYERFDKESFNHFLLKEDRESGIRFSDYATFSNYVNSIKANNGVDADNLFSDKAISYYESIDQTTFAKNDIVISGEIHFTASNFEYNFLKMYIKDSSLILEFTLYTVGAGWEADDNAIHVFYINKEATFDSVKTVITF